MAKKRGSSEYEYHIVATRMRVLGSGNLRQTLTDLSQVQSSVLQPIVMTQTTRFEPTTLSNFQSQRTRLEIKTTEIDEWFRINRIIIFAKAVAAEYPM